MAVTDASGGAVPAVDKKIIKNGNLNLRVDSVDKAAEKITEIAKSNGGDVFSSNFNQYKTSSKSGNITLKVPFKNFEKTFGEVKKVAIVVVTESTTGQDVTEQYTDLQAQLKNKQAEEQSYVRLLDQAQKMDDIIAITRQLSVTRGEIERLQGRIRLMDAQTDMATISVSLSEDVSVTIVDSWRPWQVVKESTRELVKSVQDWIDFIIRLIIKVIPVLLLYGLILYIFYRIGKALYRKFWKKETPVQ
jgi:galactitol-specific phosphotransferase system IIB component